MLLKRIFLNNLKDFSYLGVCNFSKIVFFNTVTYSDYIMHVINVQIILNQDYILGNKFCLFKDQSFFIMSQISDHKEWI